MKYYVYAGYYENFISGHKLPKPYTLRDEFKTFDDALDYVLENWEDDAIFFTEDVISDAIDNGFINDEDWENYLMEESKKSARKSIKESINANSILSKVETIVGKTKIKHPKAEIIELDGTKYIYYSYFDRGFDDDALDRVWDKCSDLKGVVDVGFGYGYGLENTKYENSLLIELDDDVIVESKKSARKSMKEQFVGKGEGGYRKPDKTKFNSGICLDSNGVKHTVIFDTHVEDFIVWVDDDNYLMWYVSSPQSLLNNLAESDLDENLILDIVALWEKLSKKHIKN